MKLSMSMLAAYLRNFNPKCSIVDDGLTISGMRFLLADNSRMEKDYLYFGHGENFFSDSKYQGVHLIVHRQSFLSFDGCDYEELMNAVLSAFDFYNRWECSLLSAAKCHSPIREFVEITAPVMINPFGAGNLDCTICICTDLQGHNVDPNWANMALGNRELHPAIYEPFYDLKGKRVTDFSDVPRLVQSGYPGGAPVLMIYLKQGEDIVGIMSILQENASYTKMNEQLATILVDYLVCADEFVSADGAARSSNTIIRDLLDGQDVGQTNLQRLTAHLPAPPWRLIIFQSTARSDHIAQKALLRDVKVQTSLNPALIYKDYVIAIASDSNCQEVFRKKSAIMDWDNLKIGTSMPFVDISSLLVHYQQAEFALKQSGGLPGIHSCETYAFDYLLRALRKYSLTPTLMHPAMEILRLHDLENQSDLRQTLSAYLSNGQRHTPTAEELHIHTNTLKYRVRRIQELTGIDFSNKLELRHLLISDWLTSYNDAEPSSPSI